MTAGDEVRGKRDEANGKLIMSDSDFEEQGWLG